MKNNFKSLIFKGMVGFMMISLFSYIWNIPIEGVMEVVKNLILVLLLILLIIVLWVKRLNKYKKEEEE